MVSRQDVEAARERIGPHLWRTPCVRSELLGEALGCRILLKFESLQRTGSFKERGALNRLLLLGDDERARGVVTASAGNHAQAVAHHATRLGIVSTIVMPRFTPGNKILSTERHGGRVVLEGETFDDALARAREIEREQGATFVHPFDDDAVIAGQGTLALELLEEGTRPDAILIPVGGGGLISGCATVLEAEDPAIEVIGVEPARCASMQASLAAGEPVTVPSAATIADGLGAKRPGERTFEIARKLVDDWCEVSEEEIASAILLLLEVEKTMVEGAGAVTLAALRHHEELRRRLEGRTVVLPLTGGNIDVSFLARIIDRGLAKDGRLAKLRIFVPDRPGSLAGISRILAAASANVLDIFHLRTFAPTEVGTVAVEVVIETRGRPHLAEVLRQLTDAGFPAEERHP